MSRVHGGPLLALVLTISCPPSGHAQQGRAEDPVRVVESFVEAFNRHDVSAMISLVTDDVELYYSDADGRFSLASASAEQLADDMRAYFADRPAVRSRIDAIIPGPIYVSFREQIVGGESSVAVYEIRRGLIRRAWYYPAEATGPGGLSGAAAREHIGERVTVCGVVASARYAAGTDGRPTFLNLDRPYPDPSLVVVIPGGLREDFGRPEETLLEARVCATGVVEEVSQPAGLLRIVLDRSDHLVVLNGPAIEQDSSPRPRSHATAR